jgi:CRISPR/Cas system CSM-associated protein Csm3 (group 7 of RAMP superfamily)
MQTSVSVLRNEPRSRDKLDGLTGRIHIRLRACSRSLGDLIDSYLHVGTGALRLVVDENELRRRATRAKNRREFEQLVQELKESIQLDYAQFVLLKEERAKEIPAVPGSSVKGNVRSRLELSFVPKDGKIRCCLIRSTNSPLQPPPPGQHGWRHFRIWQRSLEFSRDGDEPCDYTGEETAGVCLLCDLFGTAGLAGLIEFSDLVGTGVNLVRVDLPTGEKLLAAPPGSAFEGTVTFRILKPEELGLLLYGMGMRDSRLGRPVLLGKSKYRRYPRHVFGVVRYEVAALELAPVSQPLEAEALRVQPGSKLEGPALDGVVRALVAKARSAFDGELLDVDEVGELERLHA